MISVPALPGVLEGSPLMGRTCGTALLESSLLRGAALEEDGAPQHGME